MGKGILSTQGRLEVLSSPSCYQDIARSSQGHYTPGLAKYRGAVDARETGKEHLQWLAMARLRVNFGKIGGTWRSCGFACGFGVGVSGMLRIPFEVHPQESEARVCVIFRRSPRMPRDVRN